MPKTHRKKKTVLRKKIVRYTRTMRKSLTRMQALQVSLAMVGVLFTLGTVGIFLPQGGDIGASVYGPLSTHGAAPTVKQRIQECRKEARQHRGERTWLKECLKKARGR